MPVENRFTSTPQSTSSPATRFGQSIGIAGGEALLHSSAKAFNPAKVLARIEQNPLADLAVKDVLGFNMPKILMTRSLKECFDAATLELSNTFITVSTSLLIPAHIMRPWVAKLSGLPKPFLEVASSHIHPDRLLAGLETLARDTKSPQATAAIEQAKNQWQAAKTPDAQAQFLNRIRNARMGATLGFLNAFGFPFWAAAFFRNGISLAKNKTSNFEAMIGLDKNGPNKNGSANPKSKSTLKLGAAPTNKLQDQLDIKAETRKQFARGLKVLSWGAMASAASAIAFGLSARGSQAKGLINFSEGAANRFFRHWDLKGKGVNQIDKWPTLIYWMAPAYLGWLDAARSKNEKYEQALKGINSTLWFFLFTPLVVNPVSRALFAKTPFAKHFKINDAEYALKRHDKNVFQRLEDDFFEGLKRKGIDFGVDKHIGIPDFADIEQKALSNPEFAHLKDAALKWKTTQFGVGLATTILFMGVMPQLLNWQLTKRRFAMQQQGLLNADGQDIPQKNAATPAPNFGDQPQQAFWMFQ